MTQLYEVMKAQLKYAGEVYKRGDIIELIGARNDDRLIGKFVRASKETKARRAADNLMFEAPRDNDFLIVEPPQVDHSCAAITAAGNKCKRDSLIDSPYCGIHKSKMKED